MIKYTPAYKAHLTNNSDSGTMKINVSLNEK
jgi:hypothetical protein